jgi:hypothetical protein
MITLLVGAIRCAEIWMVWAWAKRGLTSDDPQRRIDAIARLIHHYRIDPAGVRRELWRLRASGVEPPPDPGDSQSTA